MSGLNLLGVCDRFRRPILLSIFVSLALAAAYVTTGIGLNDAPNFVQIDRFAFTIALFVGALVPIGYFLRFRDVSETIAVFLVLAWALFSGLEDIFVYALLGRLPPAQLPWLMDAPVGIAAAFLGMETVTGQFLIIFVGVSGVATLLALRGLTEIAP